jgi:hypothetical protein
LDLVSQIRELAQRISILERTPRIGNTAIDTGQITVKGGDVVVETPEGVDVIRITQSGLNGTPEIRLSPLGAASTHVNTVTTNRETIDGSLQTVGKFEVVNLDGDIDGGFAHLYETGAKMGWHRDSDGLECFWQVGTIASVVGAIRAVGRWMNGTNISTEAILPWTFDIGAGFGGTTAPFSPSFTTAVIPIVGLLNSGGVVTWCITAQSSSSVTILWSGTAAKTVNLWVARI